MKKTVTCVANEFDLQKIQELKEFYAECYNCNTNEISTTDIIKWGIGLLHRVKVKQDFRWVSLDDLQNGNWTENYAPDTKSLPYSAQQNN